MRVERDAGKGGTLKSLHVFMAEKGLNTALRFNIDLPGLTRIDTSINTGGRMRKAVFNLISLPLYLVLEGKRITRA